MNFCNNEEIDNQNVPVEFVEISSLMKLHIKSVRKKMMRIIHRELNEEQDETGEKIREIMEYAVFLNKRHFRSFFTALLAESFGLAEDKTIFVVSAIELMYSHYIMQNAMPDFENDDYIGGKETCHKKFGKDKTIIASNALFSLVFHSISNNDKLTRDERCKIISIISKYSGRDGVCGGDMMKVLMKKKKNRNDEIIRMQKLRVKAFYDAGMECVVALAGIDEATAKSLRLYLTSYYSLLEAYKKISSASSSSEELFEKAKLSAKQAKQQLSRLKIDRKRLVKLIDYTFYLIEQDYKKNNQEPVVVQSDFENFATT